MAGAHVDEARGSARRRRRRRGWPCPPLCEGKSCTRTRTGLALGAPGAPAVLELPHQFLLLGVHREHRLAPRQERPRLRVEVRGTGRPAPGESGPPCPCGWPAGCSPARAAGAPPCSAPRGAPARPAPPPAWPSTSTSTAARPPGCPRSSLHHRLERRQQRRIGHLHLLAAAAGPPPPPPRRRATRRCPCGSFAGQAREPRQPRDAPPHRQGPFRAHNRAWRSFSVRKNRRNVASSKGAAVIPPSIAHPTGRHYCCRRPDAILPRRNRRRPQSRWMGPAPGLRPRRAPSAGARSPGGAASRARTVFSPAWAGRSSRSKVSRTWGMNFGVTGNTSARLSPVK